MRLLNKIGIVVELALIVIVGVGHAIGDLSTEGLLLGLMLASVMGIERKMVLRTEAEAK